MQLRDRKRRRLVRLAPGACRQYAALRSILPTEAFMQRFLSMIPAAALALMLGACVSGGGSGGGGAPEVEVRAGVVEQVSLTQVKSNHDQGLGAIVGGIAGAGLGSLIGAGTGRDVAIAAGAIVGAVGGNYAQQKYYDKPQEAQQVIVRLKSGVLVSVTQPVNPALRPGLRVYVEGSGYDARVVPQQ
jgi:outer membrane lipoprotein SlyB